MKKFYLLTLAILSATMMHAGLGLSVEGCAITGDTTLTVTHVEIDDFTGESVMGWSGLMFYQGDLTVYIERTLPCREEDHEDQLCAGSCQTGTAGALCDTMSYDLKLYPAPVQVYAHYYPTEAKDVQTIKYHFVGGGDDFTLTVVYDPKGAAISKAENHRKSTKVIRNGQIMVVNNGVKYNILGSKL